MRIIFGADHGGVNLKKQLSAFAQQLGHTVQDAGTDSDNPVDYPDFAQAVGTAIQSRTADYGVLICRTGIGMCISANKIHGVRAAIAYNPQVVTLSRQHNDSNVLCFGADFISPETAKEYLQLWLTTPFSGEERHLRRVKKIQALEE